MGITRFREIVPRRQRIGLVLSGGGVKAAAFHLGVSLALHEKGFRFQSGLVTDLANHKDDDYPWLIKTYVGSSAGGVVGTMLASGHSLETIFDAYLGRRSILARPGRPLPRISYRQLLSRKRAPMDEDNDPMLASLSQIGASLLKSMSFEGVLRSTVRISGFFTTVGVEEYIRSSVTLTNNFNNFRPNLYVTATQLNHGRKIIFGKSVNAVEHDKYLTEIPISHAVAASTTVPILYRPYPIFHENKRKVIYYTDGEVRDTLSTHVAVDDGCDLVIVSHTHQPYRYDDRIGSLHKYGIPAIVIQTIYQALERKIENFKERQNANCRLYDEIHNLANQHKLSEEQKNIVLGCIEKTLNFKRDIRYIYINPDNKDSRMFFMDHFTLNPQKLTEVVKAGFRAAINSLRKFEFEGIEPQE